MMLSPVEPPEDNDGVLYENNERESLLTQAEILEYDGSEQNTSLTRKRKRRRKRRRTHIAIEDEEDPLSVLEDEAESVGNDDRNIPKFDKVETNHHCLQSLQVKKKDLF